MTQPRWRHLYIAGFMGTGKTTVGQTVANRRGRQFWDLDRQIVELVGCDIPAFFQSQGESVFRAHESKALRLLAAAPPAVIALGGGTPTVAANVNVVKQTGLTVLLTADTKTIWNRIRAMTDRPLLLDGTKPISDYDQFARHAESILLSRDCAYRAIADYTVDTSDQPVDAVATRIIQWIESLA